MQLVVLFSCIFIGRKSWLILKANRQGVLNMFCPKCRYEYVGGIMECPKCKVLLIEKLTQNNQAPLKPEYSSLVTVFATADLGLLAIVKSILDGAGIKYFAKGEMLQGILPVQSGAFNAVVEIQVRNNDADDARALLKA